MSNLMKNNVSLKLVLLIGMLANLVVTTGCTSLGLNGYTSKVTGEKEIPWWKKEELPPPKQPAKIVAIWSSSVLNQPGGDPMRGLGGRVYFYDEKHKPVRVDGNLSVFLYNDSDHQNETKQEATKQIQFTKEEVARNYRPSEFGPSYSFWVPWDEVGSERVQLSVIPVYTSNDGQMLAGDQARYLLPGPAPMDAEIFAQKDGVVPASFEASGANEPVQLQSTTIKVPRSVQQRLLKPSGKGSSTSSQTNYQEGTDKNPYSHRSQPQTTDSVSNNRVLLSDQVGPRLSNIRRSTLPAMERNTNRSGTNWRPTKQLYKDVQSETSSPMGAQAGGAAGVMPNSQSQATPGADSQLDPRQVQAWQSAQQAAGRAPNALDRAKSLFVR